MVLKRTNRATGMFLALFAVLIASGSAESEGNAFVFTHSTSSSHLTVLFNVADKLSNFDVYDVRWPMVESIAKYKAPERFRSVFSDRAMEWSAKLQQWVDASGWDSEPGNEREGRPSLLSMIASGAHLIVMPCDFKDPIVTERTFASNVTLIDPFSTLCGIARARDLRSRYVFVSALIEPMALSSLSGGELPQSYAMSNILAKPCGKMNLVDRSLNFFSHGFFSVFIGAQLPLAGLLFGQNDFFAPVEPSFVLVNGHRFLDEALPRTFAYIDIAHRGNVVAKAEMDVDLLSFVENAAFRKIVVFSMSTYTSDGEMPESFRKMFVEAFSDDRFKDIGFVWRIKAFDDEFKRPNIKTVSWIAQRALFEHPKTSGVISHCGRNSFLEAVQSAIPVLCIPQTGDQFYQAAQVEELGVGLTVQQSDLNVDLLIEAIDHLINDEKIHNKVSGLYEMLNDDEALYATSTSEWWLRYFIRHGDDQLRKFVFPKMPADLIPFSQFVLLAFVLILAILS